MELWNPGVLTGSRLRPGALGACMGWLAAGGWQCYKHKGQRRAGPGSEGWDAGVGRTSWEGVGYTSRDAAGLISTNRNRIKVARTSVENGL